MRQNFPKHYFFNPRLREGGDRRMQWMRKKQEIFNPRLREGGDLIFLIMEYLTMVFSIHASAKEATEVLRFTYKVI